jgi:hypothetical protein
MDAGPSSWDDPGVQRSKVKMATSQQRQPTVLPPTDRRTCMRTLIAAAILAAAVAASPAQASGGSHTESCGQSVITVGDPITKVRNACGEPWRVVQLENVFGAGVGERWEYERTTGMVQFWIQGGKVVRIDRI